MNGDCIYYNIRHGDTLYSISRRYNVPIALIINANPFAEVYNLQIGEAICIPVIKPSKPMDFTTYLVEEGDTIRSILDKFGIELDHLLHHNDLNGIYVLPGTTLQLPIMSEEGQEL